LLQQKRNELEECKNNLEEVMNKAVKLHNEVETDKYRISKLWYKLMNICVLKLMSHGRVIFTFKEKVIAHKET